VSSIINQMLSSCRAIRFSAEHSESSQTIPHWKRVTFFFKVWIRGKVGELADAAMLGDLTTHKEK